MEIVALALACTGFIALLIWVGVKKKLFIEDSSLHWAAMLLLLCCLVLAGVIDDVPSRRLRLFSLLAILLTVVSHSVVTSPMHFAFTARDDPASALSTLVILVAGTLVLRAWCRYLCPWGHVLGFLHRFSRLRILPDAGKCTRCGVCNTSCAVAAIDHGVIRTAHCQFCYACVDHCPNAGLKVVDVWSERAKRGHQPLPDEIPQPSESPST